LLFGVLMSLISHAQSEVEIELLTKAYPSNMPKKKQLFLSKRILNNPNIDIKKWRKGYSKRVQVLLSWRVLGIHFSHYYTVDFSDFWKKRWKLFSLNLKKVKLLVNLPRFRPYPQWQRECSLVIRNTTLWFKSLTQESVIKKTGLNFFLVKRLDSTRIDATGVLARTAGDAIKISNTK